MGSRFTSWPGILLVLAVLAVLVPALPRGVAAQDAAPPKRIHEAYKAELAALAAAQRKDGSWAAEGDYTSPGMTALALVALTHSGAHHKLINPGDPAPAAVQRDLDHLAKLQDPRGRLRGARLEEELLGTLAIATASLNSGDKALDPMVERALERTLALRRKDGSFGSRRANILGAFALQLSFIVTNAKRREALDILGDVLGRDASALPERTSALLSCGVERDDPRVRADLEHAFKIPADLDPADKKWDPVRFWLSCLAVANAADPGSAAERDFRKAVAAVVDAKPPPGLKERLFRALGLRVAFAYEFALVNK